ncbi:lysozyme g-like [Sylvia borin]
MLLHCSERYGNILNVDTTGALEATVKPDGLSCVGGVSAYNAGVNTVHTYDKIDIGKIHNYANDVDARARFYKEDGH